MYFFIHFRRFGHLPRVLMLAPTRELAKQVEKEIKESAPYLNTVCVYGGVSYVIQQNALSRGVDVVVGTPGRIIDLIKGNSLKLGEVQYLVLDEADQMLAVGFEEDVEMILDKLPSKRQSMLFSATMPGWVKKLARKYLNDPLTIDLVKLCSFGFFSSLLFPKKFSEHLHVSTAWMIRGSHGIRPRTMEEHLIITLAESALDIYFL